MSSILTNPTGLAAPLLGPLITLNLWTFLMEAWLYAERLPAMTKYGVQHSPNITKEKINAKVPPKVQWPAENFAHLHEQPTWFISTLLTLTYLGVGDKGTVWAAWAYVGLRVAHSLVHASYNDIITRFSLFIASSVVLFGLGVRTAVAVYGAGL